MRTIKSLLGIGDSDAMHRAAVVSRAADELAHESRQLNDKLRPYAESPDPFKALLIDLSNKRAAREQMRQWDLP